jgi:hypothetical protein
VERPPVGPGVLDVAVLRLAGRGHELAALPRGHHAEAVGLEMEFDVRARVLHQEGGSLVRRGHRRGTPDLEGLFGREGGLEPRARGPRGEGEDEEDTRS